MMKNYAVRIRKDGVETKSYIKARSADSADKKAYGMMIKAKGDRYIVYRIA